MRKTRPVIDRILARSREDENGCWIFQGAKSVGYGVVGLGRRAQGVGLCHRITYEFFRVDVPAGLDLDHLCRTRACCNPWHLEPVTRKVNAHRGLYGPGYAERLITHCKWGHEFTPENTRRSGGQRHCRQCARDRYYNKKKAA